MNGWLIAAILLAPLINYLLNEWIKNKKWPHKWTCPYCKSNGTTISFSSNKFDITRHAQLKHLDDYHAGSL